MKDNWEEIEEVMLAAAEDEIREARRIACRFRIQSKASNDPALSRAYKLAAQRAESRAEFLMRSGR